MGDAKPPGHPSSGFHILFFDEPTFQTYAMVLMLITCPSNSSEVKLPPAAAYRAPSTGGLSMHKMTRLGQSIHKWGCLQIEVSPLVSL